MNVLDLFSGIGGFSLGLERAGMKTVAFCEIDKPCQAVLKKHWPDVPIFEDVTKLKGSGLPKDIDVICGGFPCQDISIGGSQKGIAGDRSGLWKEFKRVINEVKPRYAIIENVERLRKNGLGVVLSDLHKIGYNAEWHCITARRLGLPMQRDRLFVISYPSEQRPHERTREERQLQNHQVRQGSQVYPNREQRQFKPGEVCTILSGGAIDRARSAYADEFTAVPSVRRVVDGVPTGLDERERRQRIKQLGNAVVPQIPELIGRAIMDYENGY